MKCLPWFAPVVASLLLASCNCVKEGVVVAKHARKGLRNLNGNGAFYFHNEPDVYWVEIESRDGKSRPAHRNVVLFRNDWSLIKVGDHWHCGQAVSKNSDGKS